MKRLLTLIICILMVVSLYACTNSNDLNQQTEIQKPKQSELVIQNGHIYLYGETAHGDKNQYDEELRIYKQFYDKGYRHLFEELPYYTTAYLNEWMKSDSNEILNMLYADWQDTAIQNIHTMNYYRYIKENFPETIFHGTDVGHQWSRTGKRYLKKLEDEGKMDSEEYAIAKQNYEQGRIYYGLEAVEGAVNDYREKCMVENFIREYDSIKGEAIMGIYGSAHVFSGKSFMCDVDTMSQMLEDHYGNIYHTDIIVPPEIIRSEYQTIAGKRYEVTFYGEVVGKNGDVYQFWKIENAYDDFKDYPVTENCLPNYNFPMKIEEKQVYILDVVSKDGSVDRGYYITDNYTWQGYDVAMQFNID